MSAGHGSPPAPVPRAAASGFQKRSSARAAGVLQFRARAGPLAREVLMRRRELRRGFDMRLSIARLLIALTVLFATVQFRAQAQGQERVPRIGWLQNNSAEFAP
jgi:hypothetical protein